MSQPATQLPPLVKIVGTIAEIIPAPASNRSGRIVLTDGKRLGAFPDKLKNVKEGGTYDFGCTKSIRDGVMYLDVKAVRETAPPADSVVPEVARNPTNGKKMDYYRPTSPEDKKSMFRCACVTAFIRAGQLRAERNEIAAAIAEIDAGYDMGTSSELPGS